MELREGLWSWDIPVTAGACGRQGPLRWGPQCYPSSLRDTDVTLAAVWISSGPMKLEHVCRCVLCVALCTCVVCAMSVCTCCVSMCVCVVCVVCHHVHVTAVCVPCVHACLCCVCR